MNGKRLVGIAFLIFIIIGCSGSYGKVRKQTGAGDQVTLVELKDSWVDYDIYYGMRSNRWASAIMFDPKNNGTKLVGDSWIRIEDQKTLNEKIVEIERQYDYAKVHIIVGADNQVFGYLYYPTYLYVPVEIADDRTLYVSSLPPYKSAP